MRASGANGWPLTMPIAASCPARSGSRVPSGSSWMISLTSSKKLKSLAWMPLNDASAMFTNPVSGGSSAWRQRVDPRREQRVEAVEGADHDPVRIGRRLEHEVAVRNVAVVSGGQEQVLAALAAIGAGVAHVGDVALPQVIDEAQRVRTGTRSPSVRRPSGRGTWCRMWSRCSPSARPAPRCCADRCRRSRSSAPRSSAARCASPTSTLPACSSRTRRSRGADRARRSPSPPCAGSGTPSKNSIVPNGVANDSGELNEPNTSADTPGPDACSTSAMGDLLNANRRTVSLSDGVLAKLRGPVARFAALVVDDD